jgi:hypothetical protein
MPEWSFNPAIATDSHGNAFAAFSYYNQTLSKYVFAAIFYTPLGGWGGFREFSTNASYTSLYGDTKVALDDQGMGYIVTLAYNGSGYQLWVAWAGLTGGQGTEEVIGGFGDILGMGGPVGISYDIDASPTGGSMVVFAARNGSYQSVYAVNYGRSGLGPVTTLDSRGGSRGYPNVAFDAQGRALAVWNYPSNALYSAPWDPSTGWGPNVTALSTGNPYYPHLAMAANGIAVVTHLRWSGSYWAPGAVAYSPGAGWGGAAFLAEQLSTGTPPVADVDDTGSAVILFRSASSGKIRGAEFTRAGWDTASDVFSNGYTTQVDPVVVSTGHGRAMAAALVHNGANFDAYVSTYSAPDTAIPWAMIDEPFDGASFGGGFASVTGWAEPGAQVTVNGARAVTWPNGSFEVSVPLGEGVNVLQARAVDAAGNVAFSNTRTVTQTNPAPLLEAERQQEGATGWLAMQQIENLSLGSNWWARVQTDAQGNAWSLWYEDGVGRTHAYATRYTRGVGWGTPEQLRVFNDGTIYEAPKFAVTPQGNALFIWNQWNTSNVNLTLWGRLWLASGGWQDPVRLDNSSNYAYQIHAAASPDGQLGAVWRQQGSIGSSTVHVAIWNQTGGWVPSAQLSPGANVTHIPYLAFTAGGTAYVTAAERVGSVDNLRLYTRPAGGAWDAGQLLTAMSSFSATSYILAAGSGTNFTVTWVQVNGSIRDWWAGQRVNGTFSQQLVMANTWDWWPEIAIDSTGTRFIALTESSSGVANARVAVAAPGQSFGVPTLLDNGTAHGGGPTLVVWAGGTQVSVMWDESEGPRSRANMRTYDRTNGTWGPNQRISLDPLGANIPHAAPMPDGGMLVVWHQWDYDYSRYQVVSRRFVPPETVPPSLTVSTPSPGFLATVATVSVTGTAEVGAFVTVNGVVADVAANGSFAVALPLVNGTNSIQVVARDAAGNIAVVWRNGTFDDPDRRRIEQLEAENAALQAQLDATNASLQAAIAAGDAALLSQITALNASLLTQLAAQNSSLLGAIASLNASLLAELAAGDATLAQLIADTNASLLADLAALDGDLTQLIADTNASLLAEMAAQNGALASSIAQTNATLFAALAAQNTALLDQLADQNASLLAAMAAADGDLAQLIADTNATLLASLAAQDADLRAALADQNMALLAELANQNDELLQAIATTNATLLAELAAGDAALHARLTADDAALWDHLNETAAAQRAALTGTQGGLDQTNSSLSGTQDDLQATTQSAASAGTMAMLGVILGAVGLALGAMAFLISRRRPPMPEPSAPRSMPPPTPGGAEEVEADVVSAPGHARGSSMAAEGELGGSYENDR